MRFLRGLAMLTLFGCGCTLAHEGEGDVETEEVESTEGALDENSGNTVWAVTASLYQFHLVGLDRSGGIYVRTHAQHDLFKYDPYGKLVWRRSLRNAAKSVTGVDAAVVDPDGNVIFTGSQSTDDPNAPLYEHCLAKMAPDGSIVFRRTWTRPNETSAWPQQIVVDDARAIWVIGTAFGDTDLGADALTGGVFRGTRPYLAKYSSTGEYLFAKTGPATQSNLASEIRIESMSLASGGGVWVTGWFRRRWDLGCGTMQHTWPSPTRTTSERGTWRRSPATARARSSASSATTCSRRPSPPRTTDAWRSAGRSAERWTFGGKSLSNGTASADMFLATFDASSGVVGWVKRGSGTASQRLRAVAFDRAGYLDVVGDIQVPEGSTKTFYLGTFSTSVTGDKRRGIVGRFTPKTGATAWVRAYGDKVLPSNGIAVSSTNRVMIAGSFNGTADFGKGPVGAPNDRRRFLMRIYP